MHFNISTEANELTPHFGGLSLHTSIFLQINTTCKMRSRLSILYSFDMFYIRQGRTAIKKHCCVCEPYRGYEYGMNISTVPSEGSIMNFSDFRWKKNMDSVSLLEKFLRYPSFRV